MSEEDTDDPKDQNSSESEDRPRAFRLRAGLRSLSTLLGNLVEVSAGDPPPVNSADRTTVEGGGEYRRRQEDQPERTRVKRVRKTTADYLIDTRLDGDEFLVTADVPGASKDDLSVGIDSRTNQLVISREGTVLERVEIPWRSPETTEAWFNNGVLEIRVQRSSTNRRIDSPR
ncbi:Hsp20/alpha crystallin family protein [Natronosalvus rutilus]|uniref:Hsp20/alpha crystallin family protein n=1 Tax=Natronosalvus rutilus TaxID=2953753 RepID=A0A9E7NCT2_9EURY|nr:Hsp20/alpha crystallin family protein [Natronosalvus rutilus]UTF55011.1 Hsp20/alpha crystallin family protein [Natronosalvus rutilus]